MTRKDSPLYVRPSLRPEYLRFMVGMLRHCNPTDFEHGVEALISLNERTLSLFDEYEPDGVRFECHRTGQLLTSLPGDHARVPSGNSANGADRPHRRPPLR